MEQYSFHNGNNASPLLILFYNSAHELNEFVFQDLLYF
jgi:hypothetical protein